VPIPEKNMEIVDEQPMDERLAINLVEIKSLAEQKSFSVRKNIVESIMAGPHPGINQKHRNSVEQRIYQHEEPLMSTEAVPSAERLSFNPLPMESPGIQNSSRNSGTGMVGGGSSNGLENTIMSQLHL